MRWNCLRAAALIPIALAIGAMGASAAMIEVTFDNDPVGPILGNDFISDNLTQIRFSDTGPQSPAQGDMYIINEGYTNNSNALVIGFDGTSAQPDDSMLQIVFDLPATFISMDLFVGPGGSPQVGGTAELTAFRDTGVNTVEVGNVSVALGAPDIFFDGAGALFDRVELEFVVPGGLIEIVDNVSVTVIPEPHAAVVFAAGALLVGVACGRRSRAEVGLRAGRR